MESLTTTAFYLLIISIGGLIEGNDASCEKCVNFKSQLGENTVANKALFYHTFLSTTRFNNFQNCFLECAGDCRCMSYNFQTRPSSDGSQLCELNTADAATRPDSLKDRPGFTYHDIVPEFNIRQVRYFVGLQNDYIQMKNRLSRETVGQIKIRTWFFFFRQTRQSFCIF